MKKHTPYSDEGFDARLECFKNQWPNKKHSFVDAFDPKTGKRRVLNFSGRPLLQMVVKHLWQEQIKGKLHLFDFNEIFDGINDKIKAGIFKGVPLLRKSEGKQDDASVAHILCQLWVVRLLDREEKCDQENSFVYVLSPRVLEVGVEDFVCNNDYFVGVGGLFGGPLDLCKEGDACELLGLEAAGGRSDTAIGAVEKTK